MAHQLMGRVCAVTGASGGIGSALCEALVAEGAHVVAFARDKARGEAAVARARRALPPGSGGGAELVACDLSSLASVRAGAAEFRRRHGVLDVLVHTAATFRRHREVTPDGLERMFATNHLGPFLLTLELMRSMQAAVAGARIFVVTAPATTRIHFDDLQGERHFGSFQAFGATKVMQLMFTAELARRIEKPGVTVNAFHPGVMRTRRIEKPGVTVNAFHPGVMRTRLMKDAPFIARLVTAVVGRSPGESAQELRDLILDPMTSRVSGQFFKGRKAVDMPEGARVLADRERLWEVSEELVGLGPRATRAMPE